MFNFGVNILLELFKIGRLTSIPMFCRNLFDQKNMGKLPIELQNVSWVIFLIYYFFLDCRLCNNSVRHWNNSENYIIYKKIIIIKV